MMNLLEEIEKCSAKAASASPQDMRALSELHTDLMAMPELANAPGSIAAGRLDEFCGAVEKLAGEVEKIVLGEAEQISISMNALAEEIADLKAVINAGGAPAVPDLKNQSKPASIAAPVTVIAAEQVIGEADAPLALEFVGEATGHLEAAEASLLKIEEEPGDTGEVNAIFRAFHTLKGVAGFLGLKQIGALAHGAESLLDLARKGKLNLTGNVLDIVLQARDVMGKMVQAVEVAANTHTAPVLQEGLQELLAQLDAAARGESAPPTPNKTVTNPAADIAAAGVREQEPAAVHGLGTTGNDAVVKVATGRLDALINAVGELVIAQAMVTQDLGGAALVSDQRLARDLSHLGKITRGLQELSMAMRMVPIAAVFQKMARLSRDVSRKAGKEVEFVQTGGETELDRNVVEAISDPLVHMVRNSIDHGIEPPQDRVKAGKPRAGRVTLKAFHQSGNVVVEITDDGRGLNKERIVQKAIAAGLVKEGQELTDQQIYQLIFQPGLSTAEKITDISGRGVGMDVVRKNVEALRGRIEIASQPGKGSMFTVRLPLTLAVIDGLIVRVGTQRYIIPITSIEQSIRPTSAELSSVQGKGELCMVRDRLLPVVRLHQLFHVTAKTTDPTQALFVIAQEGPNRCCLLVDELVGQQQVVIKSVGKEIGELPGIAGCAILGDGNVSLILDVAGIIHSALK